MALNQKSFGDIITFTRASAATRINSIGVIESVAANVPRIDYDPVTLAVKGLLVEEQRINMLLNCLIDGTPLTTQSVAVTAVAHTLSFYGTGSVALSGAYTGNLVGGGAYPTRSSLTFTPSAGTLTLTVTGDVKFANLGPGTFPTSFIPTAGSQVSRAADVPSINSVTPWYNQASGTVFIEVNSPNAGGNLDRVDFAAIGTSWSNNSYHSRTYSSQNRNSAIYDGTTNQFTGVLTSGISGINKVALAIAVNDCVIAQNGVCASVDAVVPVIPSISSFWLGHAGSGIGNLCGHIRKFRYYPKRLTNAELQALTA